MAQPSVAYRVESKAEMGEAIDLEAPQKQEWAGRRSKRSCVLGTSVCCVSFLLALGLTIYFMYPREPTFKLLENATLHLDPPRVNQTIAITNPNYYPIKLYNADFTASNTPTGISTPITISEDTFTIPKRSQRDLNVYILFEGITTDETNSLKSTCAKNGDVTFDISGTVSLKVWYHDFKDEHVSEASTVSC